MGVVEAFEKRGINPDEVPACLVHGHGPFVWGGSAAAALETAIALEGIPPEASISSQGTLLPHLSQRKEVWEFPDLRDADYVIIDRDLPITDQSRASGFDAVLETLAERGYSNILVLGSVRVYRRDASP